MRLLPAAPDLVECLLVDTLLRLHESVQVVRVRRPSRFVRLRDLGWHLWLAICLVDRDPLLGKVYCEIEGGPLPGLGTALVRVQLADALTDCQMQLERFFKRYGDVEHQRVRGQQAKVR